MKLRPDSMKLWLYTLAILGDAQERVTLSASSLTASNGAMLEATACTLTRPYARTVYRTMTGSLAGPLGGSVAVSVPLPGPGGRPRVSVSVAPSSD